VSKEGQADALAGAIAAAMRDSFRQWAKDHSTQGSLQEVWANDVRRIEVYASYTPEHRGSLVIEVHGKRNASHELYPYSLVSDGKLKRRKPRGK
jgi:hypothetical protein